VVGRRSGGRASGRSYSYDADYPLFWVLAEDLEQLASRAEFALEPPGPVADDPVLAAPDISEEVRPDRDGDGRNAGGRPRTAPHELQMIWHLRFHDGRRANAEVARLVFGPRLVQYRQPANAIAQRLRVCRERITDPDTDCPFCSSRS